MKHLITISLAGVMFATVGLAQSGNTWLEQWFQAKTGHYSSMEQARQRDAQANTAYREETAPAPRAESATPTNAWLEQWFQAKTGHYSAMEEARQRAANQNVAFREEIAPQAVAEPGSGTQTNAWLEQWFKAKYGR